MGVIGRGLKLSPVMDLSLRFHPRGCVKSRKWHAPKGQKLLAQGSALGVMHQKAMRPVRAKALIMNTFALTGRIIYNVRLPRALPWARRNLGFQPALFEF